MLWYAGRIQRTRTSKLMRWIGRCLLPLKAHKARQGHDDLALCAGPHSGQLLD